MKIKSAVMQPYNKKLKQPSRDLRNNMTDAEQLLWQRLRRKQILGLQFYRLKPILNFIVDFYCRGVKLKKYKSEFWGYDSGKCGFSGSGGAKKKWMGNRPFF